MTKKIFAHRGLSRLAPENTLAAYRELKKHGVKWFETDIDITKDGDIVMLHDADLDRTTDHSGPLHDLSHDEMLKVDAGSWFSDVFMGEPLPTLSQVIQVINEDHLNVNFELKDHLTTDLVLLDQLITQFSVDISDINDNSQILVSSFSTEMLQRFSAVKPTIKTAMILKKEQLGENCIEIAQKIGANAVHPQVVGLTKNMVRSLKEAGFDVNVWTVNSLSKANQLFNWGVDGVFTDISHKFPTWYFSD